MLSLFKVSATDQALFPILKSRKIIGIMVCLQNWIFEREKRLNKLLCLEQLGLL